MAAHSDPLPKMEEPLNSFVRFVATQKANDGKEKGL